MNTITLVSITPASFFYYKDNLSNIECVLWENGKHKKNILKARVTIHYSLKKRSPDCLPRYAECIHIDSLNFCLIVVKGYKCQSI